jgi:hypothetical protein
MQRANQDYAAAVARASTYRANMALKLFVYVPTPPSEALHAQISETLCGILSDDEFAAEAPG